MKKQKGISLLLTLLLMGFVPLFLAALIMTVLAVKDISKETETGTYEKLQVGAHSVNEYFAYDVIANGYVDYEEYSDHEFIESMHVADVELTLFKDNTRLLTSLKNSDGSYNEGSQADEKIYNIVKSGKTYKADDVVINGVDYYVFYEPIYDGNGEFWGMAFAGTPQKHVQEAESGMITKLIIIAVVIGLLFGLIIAILAIRIRKSIVQVCNGLTSLSNGELGNVITISDAISEIQTMIFLTNDLQNKMSGVIGTVKDGTNVLASSISDVSMSAVNAAEAAEQISTAMDELADSTVSLTNNVQDVNIQAQTMGDCILGITDNINALSAASDEIKNSTEEAQNYMNKVLDSSALSTESVVEITDSIELTNESIEKITEAVNLITDIASQTNLLSLNASIEAARAGEAGRGFAVVAEEIGKLSQESAYSAETIRDLANDMRSKSASTVELASKISNIIDEEQNDIKSTQHSFEALGASIEESLAMIAEIASKTSELTSLKDGILSNMSDLSAVSEENAATNEEVTASVANVNQLISNMASQSESMKSMSDGLEVSVAYFK